MKARETMARIQQPERLSGSSLVADLATGELLDLRSAPPETLAAALDALRVRQREYKEWGSALEDELRRRLAMRQRKDMVWGDWEVTLKSTNESVWDVEGLEAELQTLIDEGVVTARECVGIVTRETVVHRTEINRLLGRLTGAALKAIEDCRSWRPKGRGHVDVTKATLIPEESQ